MKGNAPKAAVAHMMRSQQIILHEGNMGAIRNGVPTAPEKGQLKPVYSAITSRKAASSLAVVICWAFSRRKICRLIGFVVWRAVWEAPIHRHSRRR